jgi:hypothetical protein
MLLSHANFIIVVTVTTSTASSLPSIPSTTQSSASKTTTPQITVPTTLSTASSSNLSTVDIAGIISAILAAVGIVAGISSQVFPDEFKDYIHAVLYVVSCGCHNLKVKSRPGQLSQDPLQHQGQPKVSSQPSPFQSNFQNEAIR